MDNITTFKWPIRVYYEDTDAGGVVYHSNYLNFMERARTEWLRALGFEQPQVKTGLGVIIVVHSLAVEFKGPAYFNDMLEVHCKLTKIGRGSIEMEQKIVREHQVLIKAQVKLAFVNADTFKPLGIPVDIKTAMLPTLAD
ncbi:MAG TPA: tol-pal system-associated acyl-CoA thioesterase [Methylotenera sp.]|nr:tol-pal system-associated acyl-CoA thioesterase [Methylotenera sp.]